MFSEEEFIPYSCKIHFYLLYSLLSFKKVIGLLSSERESETCEITIISVWPYVLVHPNNYLTS
jgi:hypothetical protein